VRVISTAWRDIQALRAEPTGVAARDADRKKTFRAALRQAEELAEAAEVVSYAAKPIQLFYSLSQAGRALAAARSPHPWMLRSHGLECQSAGMNVLAATVDPVGGTQAAFQTITAAAGSPALAGKAQIGALWAANPDLVGVPIRAELGRGQWPAALSYGLGTRDVGRIGPAAIDPRQMQTTTGGRVHTTLDVSGDTGEQIARALGAYPSLAGAAALTPSSDRYVGPAEPVERIRTADGQQGVRIGRDAPGTIPMAEYWELEDSLYSVVEVDPRFPTRPPSFIGYAIPAIAGGPSPLPMLLWWALLLGLSSLARYEPVAWTTAIDLDASPLAVHLQAVLDIAAEWAPARILESLKAAQEPNGER
jgi:hypothetical protein